MSLVVVGSLALDSIETRAGSVTDALGGSAVYASVAASYLTSAYIVGVVGEDFPEYARELLAKHRVNTDGLETVPGKTFRWSGKYQQWNNAETLNTELNVFADFQPHVPDCCRCCRSLLLANIHPTLQLQVLDQINSYQWVACDTMNFWITGAREELEKVIRRVDIVFMNEAEIMQFTSCDDVFHAARAVMDMGVKLVVIKRGEYGSIAISGDTLFFAPAYPVDKVVDPTGAGDSFAGGFMGYLANSDTLDHASIREAVLHGTVLAAKNVGAFSVNGIAGLSAGSIGEMVAKLKQWTS